VGSPRPAHLSVGDLQTDILQVQQVVQRLEIAGDAVRTDITRVASDTKQDLARFAVDVQALCSEVSSARSETRLARQEAQQALAELDGVRTGLQGQEARLRALATEAQHLRDHVSSASERTSSKVDTSHTRLAADNLEIRGALDELGKETLELRQSVLGLEQAARHHRAENMGLPGQTELLKTMAASEQSNSQRIAEVQEMLQAWQRRATEQRQGIIQNAEDIRNALEADIQELRVKLDLAINRGQLDEWAKLAAAAADSAAGELDDGLMQEKLKRMVSPSKPGIEDMPRAWRSALEDAVRRVHWVSDEARREMLRRSEEDRANTEARLTKINAEQARRLAEAQDLIEEALRRADGAMSAARLNAELGKEQEDALGRRLAEALGATGAELRAELKAARGEMSKSVEEVAHAHRMRCASLEEACAGVQQDVARIGKQGCHAEDAIKSLEVSVREVSQHMRSNARGIDEQKAKFTLAFDPFKDDVDRNMFILSQELEQLKSLVHNNTSSATSEVAAAKANLESNIEVRYGELNSSITQLSSRVDCEVMKWAERVGKVEALKRKLGEEATAAVDARWSELGDFAKSLRDTLLAEVHVNLASKLHNVDDITARVTDLRASLELTSDQATKLTKRGEQLQLALAAAERTAAAGREDSAEALRRARRLETLLASYAPSPSTTGVATSWLSGDSGSLTGTSSFQSGKNAAASAPPSPAAVAAGGASGSAIGAARLLRTSP